MQGKKKDNITAEWILKHVSEWQVYRMYIPKFTLNRKILSPFRKETTPSFSIFVKGMRVYHRDYGATDIRGGCFDLVCQMFSLSYSEALQKVAEDFGLVERKDGHTAKKVVWEQPELIEEEIIINTKVWKTWKQQHIDYLAAYHLAPEDLNFCPDTKAFPLREWAINGQRQDLDENEPAFVYNLKNERGSWVKVYRPLRNKKEKWRTTIPFNEMHGLENMRGCDTGILTKSLKDGALIHKYILPCVCIIQAEDISAITPENMTFLKETCKNLYVALDNDKKGKEASHAITKEMGVKHVNPPDRLLDDKVTDFSDWAKKEGVEAVIQHFKKKHIIQ